MGRFEKKIRLQSRGVLAAAGALAVLAVLAGILLFAGKKPESPEQAALPPLEENPYSPEDFFYLGDYMACFSAKTVLGVDVSQYQQQIDWQQVRAAGMRFAMVRLGYRGYTSGQLHEDERWEENLRGAADAGLQTGVYFFSQAVSEEEAEEEARFVLELLDGRELDYPVVFDWEYVSADARTAQVDAETLTRCALAFCRVIREAGYRPMVYFNPDLARSRIDLAELTEYDFWLAQYNDTMTFSYAVDMWQYTDQGTVPGISTPVDINLAFIDSLFPG